MANTYVNKTRFKEQIQSKHFCSEMAWRQNMSHTNTERERKKERSTSILQCPCHSSLYPQPSASFISTPSITATHLHPILPKRLAWLQCEYSLECSFINEGMTRRLRKEECFGYFKSFTLWTLTFLKDCGILGTAQPWLYWRKACEWRTQGHRRPFTLPSVDLWRN